MHGGSDVHNDGYCHGYDDCYCPGVCNRVRSTIKNDVGHTRHKYRSDGCFLFCLPDVFFLTRNYDIILSTYVHIGVRTCARARVCVCGNIGTGRNDNDDMGAIYYFNFFVGHACAFPTDNNKM